MTKMADTIDEIFEDIWRKRNAPVPEETSPQTCTYYQQFATWADKKCQEAIHNPTPKVVYRNLFQVFLKYMEWRAQVPKAHRNHIGDRGHRCLFHVLEAVYYQLISLKLEQFDPPLYDPPPPPPPPTKVVKVYRLDSFPIGELEEDEDDE